MDGKQTLEGVEGSVAPLSFRTLRLVLGSLILGGLSLYLSKPFSQVAIAISSLLGWLGFIQVLNHFSFSFPKSLKRGIHWLHAMSFEAIAVAFSLAMRPTGYLFHHKSVGNAKGRPILLVHGYLHDSSGWIYQKKRLVEEGFGPIYVLNLNHPFRSIRRYAEKLQKKAKEIEKETGRKDLILIGHSMGGLVSCWYALKVAPTNKVTDVITIGSPLSGTRMAEIAIGPNAKEMERDSSLVGEIQQEIEKRGEIRFFHIGTKTDQLVIPNSSAILGSNKERQFVVEDIGHLTLLFSPRVAAKISEWLRGS